MLNEASRGAGAAIPQLNSCFPIAFFAPARPCFGQHRHVGCGGEWIFSITSTLGCAWPSHAISRG